MKDTVTIVEIHCGCCGTWTALPGPQEEASARFKQDGWRCNGQKNYCPKCWKVRQRMEDGGLDRSPGGVILPN